MDGLLTVHDISYIHTIHPSHMGWEGRMAFCAGLGGARRLDDWDMRTSSVAKCRVVSGSVPFNPDRGPVGHDDPACPVALASFGQGSPNV